MKHLLNTIIFLLLATSVAALDTPQPSTADSRVRYVTYNESDVVRVVGTIRTAIQIVLAPSEEISWVANGDNVAWESEPRGNILFLKPRETNPPTNLQVVAIRADGSLRTYTFELIIRTGEISNGIEDVYFTVRFQYPHDEASARREEQAKERQAASERLALERLAESARNSGVKNWKYLIQGPMSLEPTSIFDNGELTVITFKRNARLPSVYLVNEDGTERIANTTTRNNEIIVHGAFPELRLRLGQSVVTLHNVGYGEGHNNTGTSTTSRSVTREIIGR